MAEYKKVYKVLLNQTQGRGLFTVHIEAHSEEYLKQLLQMDYRDCTVASYKETQILEESTVRVGEMIEKEEYTILAGSDDKLDTVTFEKDNGKLYVSRSGVWFKEGRAKYSYNIEEAIVRLQELFKLLESNTNKNLEEATIHFCLELMEEELMGGNLDTLTIGQLESLDWTVYESLFDLCN
ncbi:hypothetical protein COF68_05770 [Bacillus toyonensis]|uniref:hypothetical protein n=1 Tax=Bacillus toyonensis TaxID=155322 RepID=UPI000BFDE87B|nr:hypothetical protein [Bacillus toyonensis]PHE64348.1 hypothetical protein COF68_05770 [Bacillus toyonensis]